MARKMKDSGVEWIGEIPEEWNIRKLKSIITCRDGERVPIDSGLRESGSYPYWGAGNITDYVNNYLFDEELVLLGEDGAPFFDKKRNVAFLVQGKIWVNNHIHVLKADKEVISSYLVHFLNIVDFGSYINGSILNKLTQSNMNRINIAFPSKYEQQKIADFLDEKVGEIDSIIAKTKETIEDYKKYKQAVITETVTRGLNPDVKMKDSKNEYLGRIPAHWTEKRLRFLGICQNGISKSSEYFGEGYPFVSYGDVNKNFVLPEKGSGLIRSSEDDRKIYSVRYGDVFFTRTSETVEEIGFASTCLKTIDNATFAGFVIRFRPNNQEELSPEFSKYYFRSDAHRKFFVKEMNLVTRASLSQELLKKLPVLLPPLKEQKEIATYLEEKCLEIDKLIAKKEKLVADLESYKKTLIYEYVTGKKEVQQATIIPFPAVVSCKDKRFAQAVLLTKILDEFENYHSGRVKVAKTLYVIENHIGFDFDTDVIRQVAGPLDEKYYKAEAIIRHNNWFSVLTQNGATRYFAEKNKNQYLTYYDRYFKDYDVEIQRIIDIFKNLDMSDAELLATAYASWNDFIIKGINFTQDDIVKDIFSWDDSKKRFSKEKWIEALNELDKKQLSPVGHGKITILENRS